MPAASPTWNRSVYYGMNHLTKDWIRRATSASNPHGVGVLSLEDIKWHNDLIVNAYDNGFIGRLLCVPTFGGQNFTAAMTPLLCRNSSAYLTNVGGNLVAADWDRNRGFTGNASNKVIGTNFTPFGLPRLNGNSHFMYHISKYNANASNTLGGLLVTNTWTFAVTSSGAVTARSYNTTNDQGQLTVNRDGVSSYLLSNKRPAWDVPSNGEFTFWQGSVKTTAATPASGSSIPVPTAPQAYGVNILSNNNAGTPSTHSSVTCGGVSLGYSLRGDAEVAAHRSAFQTLLVTNYGRSLNG